MPFDVPILLCVFNRPGLTSHVFDAIAQQKPKHLLIAGDGPRSDRQNDLELVQQTKEIVTRIDWDCAVDSRFSTDNLGCRAQIAQAVTWGFEQHERLIILEDDCVPNKSFFDFCRELLERYANEPRVMTISGNSYPTSGYGKYSYRFSKYPLIWGWASWRRAWNLYDLDMRLWRSREIRKKVLDKFTVDDRERNFWNDIFDRQSSGEINTWDYSWTFASWANNGLSVLPKQNLVTNIGFGQNATHTFDESSPMANRLTHPMSITGHPTAIARNRDADQEVRRIVFEPPPITPPPARKSLFSRIFGLPSNPLAGSRQHTD